jgi:hypothetical protein
MVSAERHAKNIERALDRDPNKSLNEVASELKNVVDASLETYNRQVAGKMNSIINELRLPETGVTEGQFNGPPNRPSYGQSDRPFRPFNRPNNNQYRPSYNYQNFGRPGPRNFDTNFRPYQNQFQNTNFGSGPRPSQDYRQNNNGNFQRSRPYGPQGNGIGQSFQNQGFGRGAGFRNSDGSYARRIPFCQHCDCEHPYGEHVQPHRPFCNQCNTRHEFGHHVQRGEVPNGNRLN